MSFTNLRSRSSGGLYLCDLWLFSEGSQWRLCSTREVLQPSADLLLRCLECSDKLGLTQWEYSDFADVQWSRKDGISSGQMYSYY